MAAQSNVNLEKCALFRCLCGVWKLNSSVLTAGQMEAPVCSPLKYSNFGHTDKSNASFKYVNILRLFVCTHNNNKIHGAFVK